jgi:uncharacterized membrane protein YgaE (UPF0421/DUF939 family)
MALSSRNKSLLAYIAKCMAGILLCSLICYFFTWIDYRWSLISVALVLSPEGKDALELTLTRIKANLVGAGTGVVLLLSELPNPYNIAVGAALSLFICDRLNLNAGARSTLAALIIILLHNEGSHVWDSALNRVSAVVIGCLLGLGITYIFHFFIQSDANAFNSESGKKEREG